MQNRPFIKATSQAGSWNISSVIKNPKVLATVTVLGLFAASYSIYRRSNFRDHITLMPGKFEKKPTPGGQTKIAGNAEAKESIKQAVVSQDPLAVIGGDAKSRKGGITQLALDKDSSASVQGAAERMLNPSTASSNGRR